VRWVELVEVVAAVEEALAVVPVAGRAGWVAPRPPVPAATASAPVAGIGSHTRWACPVTRKSARSAARRWCANKERVRRCPASCVPGTALFALLTGSVERVQWRPHNGEKRGSSARTI
jgi:DsbC/DsbD-like thiol-disulfide interchange protein